MLDNQSTKEAIPMSTEREELTAEQNLIHQVVNKISDKYTYAQIDSLITDAKKISDAILGYKSDK